MLSVWRKYFNYLVGIFVIFAIIKFVEGDESAYARLRRNLLASYDPRVIPSKGSANVTNLTIDFIPQSFTIDESTSMFSLSGMLDLAWTDERLKWEPSLNDNVTVMHFSPQEIWKPELTVFNDAPRRHFVNFHMVGLTSHYTGTIFFMPIATFQTKCVHDLQKWPFDSTTCVVRIGSWMVSGDDVFMIGSKVDYTGKDLSSMILNHEWHTQGVTQGVRDRIFECCPSFQEYRIEWALQRRPGHSFAIIFIPAIAIAMTILTSFWIHPAASERLALIMTALMINTIFLTYTHNIIPPNGDHVPLAIMYYRDSLALILVALLWTICSRYLAIAERSVNLPNSIKVIDPLVCRLLCLDTAILIENGGQNEGQENEPSGRDRKDWTFLAQIIDRLVFILFLITYIIFVIKFF